MNIPDFLKSGYRILMLIKRNKDRSEGELRTTDRKSVKVIVSGVEQFDQALQELNYLRFENQRIYCSVNERSMHKAIRMFKERQLQNDYESTEHKEAFYSDIQNRFLSCLQNPSCKASSLFLIDVDHKIMDKIEATKELLAKHTEIVFEKETINGFHFVTKPFNPSLVEFLSLSIKKDDMLFIEGGNNDSANT